MRADADASVKHQAEAAAVAEDEGQRVEAGLTSQEAVAEVAEASEAGGSKEPLSSAWRRRAACAGVCVASPELMDSVREPMFLCRHMYGVTAGEGVLRSCNVIFVHR